MPVEDCEFCGEGEYWECGPEGSRCEEWNEPNEDRCHFIWVLLRHRDDCCEARLWLPGVGDPPRGWTVYQRVPIRVATNYVRNQCVARVYAPPVDCREHNVRCPDSGEDPCIERPPRVDVTVNVIHNS